MLSCLNLRWVAVKDQRLRVLLPASSGSFQLVGSAVACLDSGALELRSCPCDPEAAALLLQALHHGATRVAAVLAVAARGCPIDHSALLHVPRAHPDPAVARPRKRIAAALAVAAGLAGQEAAIAGMGVPFLYSTRGEPWRCASLLRCRRRSRRRVAVGGGWCTVT